MQYIHTSGQIKYIDEELFSAWIAANNPKATGWSVYTPPPEPSPLPYVEPVPEEVGPAQLRIVMRRMYGISRQEVEAVINNITDEAERLDAETLWEYATEIRRNHPLVAAFAAAFNLTEEDVDNAFRVAATI